MTSRVQLALNVADLDTATDHYRKMFGIEPHKTRPGYANFEIADPPLKLVLFEHPGADGPLNHLGVELVDQDAVAAAGERFDAAGLETRASSGEVCCHAEQNKVYVSTPDVPIGVWEFYTITDDDPSVDGGDGSGGVCCATGPVGEQSNDGGCCA
jgi:catechol 2,3-dioxygenase-like lactoylglutathione lyase family enzyme